MTIIRLVSGRGRKMRAVSLMELTIVMAIVGILAGGSIGMFRNYSSLREKTEIEAALAVVASAQNRYLVHHPRETYASLSFEKLRPYLPGYVLPQVLLDAGATTNLTVNPPTAERNGQLFTASQY